MKTHDLLMQRLGMIFQWCQGMVDPEYGLLQYFHLPNQIRFSERIRPSAISLRSGALKC